MAVNTDNFGFKKPDESDFYDVQDQNGNWDIADQELEKLNSPTFEDYTEDTSVPEAVTAIEALKSKSKIGMLLSNIKAAFKGACLIGHIVNNCVTDNPNLPLSAAQGKALQDALTVLNNELKNTENIALTDPEKFLKQISNVADIYGTAIKIVDKNGNDRIIYSSNLASRDFYFRSVGLTKTSTGTYIEFIAADDKKYKLLVDDIL